MSVDIHNAKPVLFVLRLGKHWYHPSKTAKASKAVSHTDHRKKILSNLLGSNLFRRFFFLEALLRKHEE